ncbi:MAG: caspase family protein [Betaproteobacteria bacterium]|nr:MAG: caspase family protein [Betaproteobacteria bacterium]
MRRRDFLAIGASLTGTFAARAALGPGKPHRARAAVVIGVNKAGNLPVLKAAASGARMVGSWLEVEGFEVRLFVDDDKSVKVGEIFDAIDHYVGRGTLDQLVVYFAGHGFVNGFSEIWMLSMAPNNPNEAISLVESIHLARESSIPNVVFISDACRSRSDSLGTERVRGSLIFPTTNAAQSVRADVDVFLASLVGNPAYEVPVSESVARFEGIYTACFLDAFRFPDDTMVRTIDGVPVVPNNKLKPYLEREVRKRAEAKSIKLSQTPDTNVVSGETTYIGRVREVAPGIPWYLIKGTTSAYSSIDPKPVVPPAIHDVAGRELERVGAGMLNLSGAAAAPAGKMDVHAFATDFVTARNTILKAPAPSSFETQTGFAVSGTRLARAVANSSIMRTEYLPPRGGPQEPALIRVALGGKSAGSVALQFSDGSGTVIAALEGYIGNVVVDGGGVSSVTYTPSRNNRRWSHSQETLKDLYAVVATTARFGVFRIEGATKGIRETKAKQLVDKIQILNRIDPTLGLYAAYAFADADLTDQVDWMRARMHGDLQTTLFDVAMLSGRFSVRRSNDFDVGVVPFCPMLTQGWGLLRVRGVRLPPIVNEARYHIRAALWTTFDSNGMDILINAFGKGRLQ